MCSGQQQMLDSNPLPFDAVGKGLPHSSCLNTWSRLNPFNHAPSEMIPGTQLLGPLPLLSVRTSDLTPPRHTCLSALIVRPQSHLLDRLCENSAVLMSTTTRVY